MKKTTDILLAKGSNLPELNRIKLIDVADIVRLTLPEKQVGWDNGVLLGNRHELERGAIHLRDGASILSVQIFSGNFSETWIEAATGDFWETRLTVFVSSDSGERRWNFEQMKKKRWVVIALDNDSKPRLVGTMKQPCRVGIGFSTAGHKGRVLNFSAETKRQAYFLPSWQDNELFAEFSEEFGYDFTA